MPDVIIRAQATGTDEVSRRLAQTTDQLDRMTRTAESLQKGLNKFQEYLKAGAVAEFANRVIKGAQALDAMARMGNTTVEFLERLKAGAKAAGDEFEPLVAAYEAFAKTQANFTAGIGRTGDRKKAFELLGFSERDLRTKTAEQNLADLTLRMKEGTLTAAQYAAGLRLMGDAFRNLAASSQKGLGEVLAGAPDLAGASTTRFLGDVGDAKDRMLNSAGKVSKRTVAGGVTALNLGVSAFYNVAALLGSSSAAKRRDELLLEREQVNSGTYGDGDAELKKRLQDKREALATAGKIAAIQADIRKVLGDDADDVLDELGDRGAREEDYERVLRRSRRQKEREAERLNNRDGPSTPAADALRRIGGFNRAFGFIENQGKEQLKLTKQMASSLKVIEGEFTAEK
jgi:hypothetical protein